MSRGIHLKQLTRAHLEALGLPEGGGQSVLDPPAVDEGEVPVPPKQGQLPLGEVPREAVTSPLPRVGPPVNPAWAPGQDSEPESELDWQPLDLGALAREIRQELEITLRLLDSSSGEPAMPE